MLRAADRHYTGSMKRWVLSAIFISSAIVFASAQGDDLPEGKGKDVLQRMCTNCHGLEQVTALRYSKKYWGNVVDDMVSRGAEGSDEDINSVIGYLARNFGKPVNVNSATAKEIETDLSFPAAQAQLVVEYRTDHGAFKSFEDLAKVPGLDAAVVAEQKKNIVF
jgi:competence ComEA-like helix-hairpin-helix protein